MIWLTVLITVETILIALIALLLVAMLRAYAELLRRLNAPTDADLVAQGIQEMRESRSIEGVDFDGEGLGGEPVTVRIHGVRENTILIFLTSGCLTCRNIWLALSELERSPLPEGTRVFAVAKDREEESIPRLRKLASPQANLVLSNAAWEAYEIPGSPYFVYVEGETGKILGEGSAESWPQIVSLLEEALEDEAYELANTNGGGQGASAREVELQENRQ